MLRGLFISPWGVLGREGERSRSTIIAGSLAIAPLVKSTIAIVG
jgi:hypothetical protein